MKELKGYLVISSLLMILLTFGGPMTALLQYLMMAEFYIHHYPLRSFLFAGILWSTTLYVILNDYVKIFRPKKNRFWVIDEKYLNEYDGYYEGILGEEKPVVVQELKDEH